MNQILEGTNYLIKNDLILKEIIKKEGQCKLTPSRTYFKNLVKSIIGQQLSTKAARTIFIRFCEKINNKIIPDNILKLKQMDFREVGVSKQKMNYLIGLSKTYKKDENFFKSLTKHSNEEIITELTKIKGIGLWTAGMFLIFSLNRLNVLPLDDVGFQNSIKLHYKLRKKPNTKKMLNIAKNWGEYSSIAAWYLWQGLDNNK